MSRDTPDYAFPVLAYDRGGDGDIRPQPTCYPGMTLRDYFAAQFAAAMCAGAGAQQVADRDKRYDETNWSEIVADNAYGFAEAMMKRREQA